LFVVVLYVREQTVLNETLRQMSKAPREQVDDALNAVRAAGLKIDISRASRSFI